MGKVLAGHRSAGRPGSVLRPLCERLSPPRLPLPARRFGARLQPGAGQRPFLRPAAPVGPWQRCHGRRRPAGPGAAEPRPDPLQPEPAAPAAGADHGLQDAGARAAAARPPADGRAGQAAHGRHAAADADSTSSLRVRGGSRAGSRAGAWAGTHSPQLQQTSW